MEARPSNLCAGKQVLLRMDIKPVNIFWRTHLKRQLKCLEPMGYTMSKHPLGYMIEKHGKECWVAKDYREAVTFLSGVMESHPFAEKIHREYLERLQNESMASNGKR